MRIDLGPAGLPLHVHRFGTDRPGRPLVALHGFLEQGAAWQWVAASLDRPLIAPDQRGHGQSGHLGPGGFYHFWDYVSDLDLLLDRLSPDQPVDLLGHSMGGTVASLYAGSRPERVSRLVLVEGLGPPDNTGTVLDRARRFLADRRQIPEHKSMRDLDAAAERIRKHNPRLSAERAHTLASTLVRDHPDGVTWAWDRRHRSRNPTPFVAAHFVQFLAAIEAPVLVVWGQRSPFPGLDRTSHLRDVRIERIPDAGHLVHLDAPAALASVLNRFLDG